MVRININQNIKNIIRMVLFFILINSTLVISHWLCLKIYTRYCVPTDFFGIVQGFFSLGSPICQSINSIQYSLSEHYMKTWVLTTGTFVTYLVNKLKLV
jgi:hypothetical protein